MKINKHLQLYFTSMGCHMLFSMVLEKCQSSAPVKAYFSLLL